MSDLSYRKLFLPAPISYADFDALTQTDLNLFALREDIDLEGLEAILDRIVSALPAMRHIFASPIIRLRDTGEILPVEAVRVVNNKTLAHISVHSELWENVRDGQLIPRKLMSIRQEDDYALYENIVFARTVDAILRLTEANLAVLRDMLYANREMSFNLLERENHPSYFLALGKLHTGYLRDYDKYLLPIERCFEKLCTIERTLTSRLSMPVYKKCKRSKTKLSLKRTNIFRSQKDYRKLYSLAKYLSDIGAVDLSDAAGVEADEYFHFCAMLCVFAAGHFNFKFDRYRTMDFRDINTSARFGDWILTIKAEGGGILLAVKKEFEYKIFLSPMRESKYDAHEVITVTPDGVESLRLSLYDIDSFRRIQQMLLRAMVYADDEHKICPFCGKAMTQTEESYECGACRTVIRAHVCPETGTGYYSTSIKNFTRKSHGGERLYYYRNITPISDEGAFLCPTCGKEH